MVDGPNYTLANYIVKVNQTGVIDVVPMPDAYNCLTDSAAEDVKQPMQASIDHFNPKAVANEILAGLNFFAKPVDPKDINNKENLKEKDAFTWGTIDAVGYGKAILILCNQVINIFKNEPRLLEVSTPAYVFGDLHGNFKDLYFFEKTFWNLGFNLSAANFLFLGDFVDRGPNGIEVICYLLAQKLKSPNRLHLVRGNHEVRHIQKMFTFYTECLNRFGIEFGNVVWEAINNVFDCMPLAAVVDGKFFCCHGGIPPPWLCSNINVINSIPCPLSRPESDSPLAWDLLWNDPVKIEYMDRHLENELNAFDGYAVNRRRGTAHLFSYDALVRFLQTNKLSHVIRAHEVQKPGFLLQMKLRLITVFSNTHYNKGTNEAAVIFLQIGKARIIKIDTSEFWADK